MSQPLVEGYRLSPAQQRLWRQHGRHIGAHRVSACVSIAGQLDPSRVVEALAALSAEHEILRTTYRQVAGMSEPVQVVEDELSVAFSHEDLRHVDAGRHAGIVDARRIALAQMPLDLEQGPVWAARLLTRSTRDATLLLTWPALVADAASVGILVRQLARVMNRTTVSDVVDPALQHVDLSEWQHQVLEAEGTAAGRQFWREIPSDLIASCRLPLRKRERCSDDFAPQSIAEAVPPDVVAGLNRWATAHFRSPEELFLACWHLLAWRLTGQSELCVGLASPGRSLDELADIVGPLTKTLPVRLTVDRRWSFAEWVERACAAYQEHRRRHEFFASNLREPRSRATCDSALVFEAFHEKAATTSDGLRLEVARIDACIDTFELKLCVLCAGGRWTVRWDYDPQVHTAQQVALIAEEYGSVLQQVATGAPPQLGDFDVRGFTERKRAEAASALVASESTLPGSDVCVHALFDAQVQAAAESTAIVAGNRRVTYRELAERAAGIAGFLVARGVGPDTRVGVMLEHSVDLLAALLGVLKAGGAFVPLPPGQPPERLAKIADRASARLVLTHAHLADKWPSASSQALVCVERESFAEGSATAAKAKAIAPDHLAYVMFTSGSTGEPKGVMISHRALVNYVRWCERSYVREQPVCVPLHSSIGFDATLTSLLAPLCLGAHIFIVPNADPMEAIRAVSAASQRFGFVKVTPAHLALMAGELSRERASTLTGTLVIGGEALLAEQLTHWREHAPGTRIVNEYGPTEATVGCLVHDTAVARLEDGPVPIGRPIPGMECCVVDAYGHEAAVGVAGELYIGGAQLARGYDGRPDLTAERFVPAHGSLTPGARWYRTGDLVRARADGSLEYLGRGDRQVKLRGYRVELGEIESACQRQPWVREAVVTIREDVPGERRLVAYVVPASAEGDGAVTTDRLQQALRAVVPEYMIPSIVVVMEALPLTRHGKVDHAQLPAPDSGRPSLTQAYAAPRTPTEAVLAKIWGDVLRRDRVGVNDNFFALGGDSIVSLQIVARAGREGFRLAPRLVFEHPTIAALAQLVDRMPGTAHDQSPVTSTVPLTPIQRWFFERALTDVHHFNQAVVLDIAQAVAPERLDAMWRELQRHHDVLRLRYRRDGATWTQYHGDVDAGTPLAWIHAADLDAKTQESLWARLVKAAHASLDLESGPLVRAVAVQSRTDGSARLLIVAHHLLVDGVSWRILLEDLHTLCTAQQPRLPAKTMSFKAWSERLTASVKDGALNEQLPFWTEMSLPAATLPRDADLGPNDVRSARTIQCTLGAEETAALTQRLPGTLAVHVQEALLAAVVHALASESHEAAWRIDLEGHGRDPLQDGDDVSRTVGWFTSLYPVRVELTSIEDAVSALRTVRGVLKRVPGSGAGYGALRYLGDDGRVAPLREGAAPEIVFNYWGQIGHEISSSPVVRPSRAARGPLRAVSQTREYLVEISASVIGGRLQMHWTYSANLLRSETVERLADRVLQTIRQLVALPDTARTSLLTAADFPLARMAQAELDALLARHGSLAGAYPLSPLQEGLLFQTLYDRNQGMYVQQSHARMRGHLNPDAFRSAWERAVARYDTLRTAFIWERREGPLQIVHETAQLPWCFEDWRDVPEAERQMRLTAWLEADRRESFALDRPPLMRIALLRLGDDEWEVVWTSHHLVLDGWSSQLVLRDVFTTYLGQAGDESQAAPARYADYIAWLQARDTARAEAFWREMLDDLRAPSLLVTGPRAERSALLPRSHTTVRAAMPAALTGGLRELGQAHGITMNTWFAGAWAVLLAYCTKQDDVVIGTVVSGRPPHLPGVETMAGLFSNTVPLRLRLDRRAPALSLFAECQQRQLDSRDFEYASLTRIQGWSELPAGTPLFDSLFVYENFPSSGISSGQTNLRVTGLDASVPTPYPLRIEITDVNRGLTALVTYDDQQIGAALAAFIATGFETALSALADAPDSTLQQLFESLDRRAHQTLLTSSERRRELRRQALQAMKAGAA